MSEQPIYSPSIMGEMQEILPGLFLSGSGPAESRHYLQEKGITHVVQVTDMFPVPRFPGEFTYKIIAVPDMDETNLIKYFPETHTFIQGALDQGGKVLVHCMAGASRSVTIVCAYMMKTKSMSAAEALLAVQALRPIADPNDGFIKQLLLYGEIEYELDINRTPYRRFLMASMASQREIFGYIEDMTLAADPSIALVSPTSLASSLPPPTLSATATQALRQPPIKCKKCRRALVARDSVITHTPGQGQNAFQYRKRNATLNVLEAIQSNASTITPQSSTTCQSYFIEPVEWIQGLHGLEGKVSCPKCDSKLGTFNWSGDQCSCGAWVTPAFMLHKGKVDA